MDAKVTDELKLGLVELTRSKMNLGSRNMYSKQWPSQEATGLGNYFGQGSLIQQRESFPPQELTSS